MQLGDDHDSDEFQPIRPSISSSISNTMYGPPNGPSKRKPKFVDDDMDEETMMCFSRAAPDSGNDIIKTRGKWKKWSNVHSFSDIDDSAWKL